MIMTPRLTRSRIFFNLRIQKFSRHVAYSNRISTCIRTHSSIQDFSVNFVNKECVTKPAIQFSVTPSDLKISGFDRPHDFGF